MKKRFRFIFAVLLLISCFACFAYFAITLPAAAFDANDYGDGGDYGDGNYRDNNGDDWGDWRDWSYDGGTKRESEISYEGATETFAILMGLFTVSIIVLIIIARRREERMKSGSQPKTEKTVKTTILPDRTEIIESIIKQSDPNFSASGLIAFAKAVYTDMETALMKRDLSPVRHLLHDNLYYAVLKQIQEKTEQDVIYNFENTEVNAAYLTSYVKDADFEYVALYLNAGRFDRREAGETDRSRKMKFMRLAGIKTKQNFADYQPHNCPNCGEPAEISSFGKCNCCKAAITNGRCSWVLCDYETTLEGTVDEGIRN